MTNKKGLFGTNSLLIGGGLLVAAIAYKAYNSPREASGGAGSLGGTDELLEQQGFDIDPNSIPEQPYDSYPEYYIIAPDGQVVPSADVGAGTEGGSGVPSNIPIASTGTGSLFQDTAAVGGAIGANIFLPSIAKRITKLVDTSYLTDAVSSSIKQTPFQKFISDPYGIKSFDDLAISKAQKTGTREIAELAIDKSGKTVLKTIPKWAKATKTVANFIPLIDIPIGAGLDVYFSRYEEDPTKKIDWKSALAANTAGELAQLGVGAAGAAAGSVIPVAGNIAGGVGGFVVGTAADIAATEAYYAATGKSSLFVGNTVQTSVSSSSQNTVSSASGYSMLTGKSTYDFSTQTLTNASGQKSSVSPANYFKSISTIPQAVVSSPFSAASSPISNSSSSGGSSTASNRTSSASTSSNVSASKSAPTSSAPKAAAAPAPKASVVSRVTSAVKSVASRVSSFFRRK